MILPIMFMGVSWVESVRVMERLHVQGIGAGMGNQTCLSVCLLSKVVDQYKSWTVSHRFDPKLGFTKSNIGVKINL